MEAAATDHEHNTSAPRHARWHLPACNLTVWFDEARGRVPARTRKCSGAGVKRAERSAADSQDQRLRRTNTRAAHTHGTTEQLCVVASSRVRRHCTANTGNADHWRECSPAVAPCTRGTLQYTAVVGMTEATARVDSVSQKKGFRIMLGREAVDARMAWSPKSGLAEGCCRSF